MYSISHGGKDSIISCRKRFQEVLNFFLPHLVKTKLKPSPSLKHRTPGWLRQASEFLAQAQPTDMVFTTGTFLGGKWNVFTARIFLGTKKSLPAGAFLRTWEQFHCRKLFRNSGMFSLQELFQELSKVFTPGTFSETLQEEPTW